MISENNEDAYSLMLNKYQPLIRKYADYYCHKYDNRGIEKEELIQEGSLGLINAIKSYMFEDKCLFYTFASLVIRREMARYVRKTLRNKQLILTNAISLNEDLGIDDLVLEDTLYSVCDNTETKMDDGYYGKVLYNFKFELSPIPAQIYELRLNNFSNKEIAVLLDISYKTVDNSLRLMKPKFKKYLQSML